MKTRLLVLAALASIVLAAQPSLAEDRARTYVASGVFSCCHASTTGGVELPVGIGGYEYQAAGDPTAIKIQDLGGNKVAAFVCQEGPLQTGETPSSCGSGDDVSTTLCSTGTFQTLHPGFKPGIGVIVFIAIVDVYGTACEGTGTAGTVTLRTT